MKPTYEGLFHKLAMDRTLVGEAQRAGYSINGIDPKLVGRGNEYIFFLNFTLHHGNENLTPTIQEAWKSYWRDENFYSEWVEHTHTLKNFVMLDRDEGGLSSRDELKQLRMCGGLDADGSISAHPRCGEWTIDELLDVLKAFEKAMNSRLKKSCPNPVGAGYSNDGWPCTEGRLIIHAPH